MCRYKEIHCTCRNGLCEAKWTPYQIEELCGQVREPYLRNGVPEFRLAQPATLEPRSDLCPPTNNDEMIVIEAKNRLCDACTKREVERLPTLQPRSESPEMARRSGRRDSSDPGNWKAS